MQHLEVLPSAERRFTADEFLFMVEAGWIGEDERVELLDGRIRGMAAKGNDHVYVTAKLHIELIRAYGAEHVRKEESLLVDSTNVPEPDLAVVRPSIESWQDRHPNGNEAYLVIEVSVSTLDDDMAKARRYARGGVPAYWIADVEGRRMLVFEGPGAMGYASFREVPEDGTVDFPETNARLLVRDVLPRS